MTITNLIHRGRIAALAAAVTLATLPNLAAADPVTLISNDGARSVQGQLVGVRDGAYVIETSVGMVAIKASQVTCEGAACSEGIPEITGLKEWMVIALG